MELLLIALCLLLVVLTLAVNQLTKEIRKVGVGVDNLRLDSRARVVTPARPNTPEAMHLSEMKRFGRQTAKRRIKFGGEPEDDTQAQVRDNNPATQES